MHWAVSRNLIRKVPSNKVVFTKGKWVASRPSRSPFKAISDFCARCIYYLFKKKKLYFHICLRLLNMIYNFHMFLITGRALVTLNKTECTKRQDCFQYSKWPELLWCVLVSCFLPATPNYCHMVCQSIAWQQRGTASEDWRSRLIAPDYRAHTPASSMYVNKGHGRNHWSRAGGVA